MSHILKSAMLAAAVLVSVPAFAATATTTTTTTTSATPVKKSKIDIHKDLVNLHKAYVDRAHDRHALAVAVKAHNKVAAAKARAEIKLDDAKIHRMTVALHKDRATLAHHRVVVHAHVAPKK